MANKYMDSSLLDKAIIFATKAHANTERRGKGFPYIVHPMEAMEIVATMTSDQEMLAAAALHDTVEDTDVTVEQIRAEFGDRVAAMVASESDVFVSGVSEEDSWRDRKKAAIDRLAAAGHDSKVVALGDKLSNMRAIYRDYCKVGDELWKLFHAPGGKADHAWHYRGLADSLRELSDTFAFQEFEKLILEVFGEPEPELVDMNDYVESGDGFTAISYSHRTEQVMMKLYAPFIPPEVPRQELKRVNDVRALGIKTPPALGMVTDGKRIGVKFQRIIDKRSYARAISQDISSLKDYAIRFAHDCKALHQTECNTRNFPKISDLAKSAITRNTIYSDVQKAKMLKFFDSVPEATTCLHGDMHIGNIITDGKETWWIDLSDFTYGNPLYDFGMFYFVTYVCANQNERLFHITTEQMREFWKYFVEEYFEGEPVESVNEKIAPFAAYYILNFNLRGLVFPEMKAFIDSIFPDE